MITVKTTAQRERMVIMANTVTLDNSKHLVILNQPAYFRGTTYDAGYYAASGRINIDGEWIDCYVEWQIREDYDPSTDDDEGNACDWDKFDVYFDAERINGELVSGYVDNVETCYIDRNIIKE